MVTDFLLAPLFYVWQWLDTVLPDGEPLDDQGIGAVVNALGTLNAFLPVAELLGIVVGLMGLVGAFMLGRLILVLRHTVAP